MLLLRTVISICSIDSEFIVTKFYSSNAFLFAQVYEEVCVHLVMMIKDTCDMCLALFRKKDPSDMFNPF